MLSWLDTLKPHGVPAHLRLCPDDRRETIRTSYLINDFLSTRTPWTHDDPTTGVTLPGDRVRDCLRWDDVRRPAVTSYGVESPQTGRPRPPGRHHERRHAAGPFYQCGAVNHFHGVNPYSQSAGTYDVKFTAHDLRTGVSLADSTPMLLRTNAVAEPTTVAGLGTAALLRRRRA